MIKTKTKTRARGKGIRPLKSGLRIHRETPVDAVVTTCYAPYEGPDYRITTSDNSVNAVLGILGIAYVVSQAVVQQTQFHILNCKVSAKGSKFDVARLLATFSDDDPPV